MRGNKKAIHENKCIKRKAFYLFKIKLYPEKNGYINVLKNDNQKIGQRWNAQTEDIIADDWIVV